MEKAGASKNVVIIGGSLSGLMQGLVLHRLGHNVRILERAPTDVPESHMAGVCLGRDMLHFLARFDRFAESIPMGLPAVQLQSLDGQGVTRPFLKIHRIMSSWDALYFRLRANFDGRVSPFVPQAAWKQAAPEAVVGATASYETGKQVLSVGQLDSTGQMTVRYRDLKLPDGPDKVHEAVADLVIGADGPNSVVRSTFVDVPREYAGYVAWRGVVPEAQVSEETRAKFQANITYSLLEGEGGHVIVYVIPGPNGSIEPGQRYLNFCWYRNIPRHDLATIMTDVNGQAHRTQVPAGLVRPEVWTSQLEFARTLPSFSAPYFEMMEQIPSPFLHLITDYTSPRATFCEDKVLVVGDAATLLRPHIAFSTNQAACHALATERLARGELTAAQWNYQVTTAGYLHWRRSLWFGQFYQTRWFVSVWSGLLSWTTSGLGRLRTWMGWLPEQAI